MLTIKTWCLPADLSEKKLNELHNAIVKSVVDVPETCVKSEYDMINLFPKDMMIYGLGNEIIIEITKVPKKCDYRNCGILADSVSRAVKRLFPKAKIECEALPVNDDAGYCNL